MKIGKFLHDLNTLIDSEIISPEEEITIHQVERDEMFDILGFTVYENGEVILKAFLPED